MRRTRLMAVALLMMVTGLAAPQAAPAEEPTPRFEVTVTNLTRAQIFTPVLVVSHR